ncbi:MAG: hypothetical protein U0174_04770 [Polyangiaceae bacterium]
MNRSWLACGLFLIAGGSSGCEGCNKPKEAPLVVDDAAAPMHVTSNSAKAHVNPSFHPQRVHATATPAPSATATAAP